MFYTPPYHSLPRAFEQRLFQYQCIQQSCQRPLRWETEADPTKCDNCNLGFLAVFTHHCKAENDAKKAYCNRCMDLGAQLPEAASLIIDSRTRDHLIRCLDPNRPMVKTLSLLRVNEMVQDLDDDFLLRCQAAEV